MKRIVGKPGGSRNATGSARTAPRLRRPTAAREGMEPRRVPIVQSAFPDGRPRPPCGDLILGIAKDENSAIGAHGISTPRTWTHYLCGGKTVLSTLHWKTSMTPIHVHGMDSLMSSARDSQDRAFDWIMWVSLDVDYHLDFGREYPFSDKAWVPKHNYVIVLAGEYVSLCMHPKALLGTGPRYRYVFKILDKNNRSFDNYRENPPVVTADG